jgi:acetoacetyl-[acyl-carrier protein] synthase
MTALPIIVGMGGINAAGRTSSHQGFRRIVLDKLTQQARCETMLGLATLMNLVKRDGATLVDHEHNPITPEQVEAKYGERILAGTLIRKIENNQFDPDATHWHQKMTLTPSAGHELVFETTARHLPHPTPADWHIDTLEDGKVKVRIASELLIKHDAYRDNPIKAAGQFPSGFEPSKLYNSRYQPRGLQATIFAATDAIKSTGLDWDTILAAVDPDKVGTYSASVAGQMQNEAFGGMMNNRLKGDRVSTKNLALGLNTMPNDFVNAYVTGNVGTTVSASGACATFLYNLRNAVNDIKAGTIRVAIVGSVDCAITPEIIEGFGNMSALANVEGLKKLDNADTADLRRTSRPFGENCGFTMGEGAQYAVLMDDALAIELGAELMGSVPDVFINADGIKKSITAPGPGNYITMAKSVALASAILGEEAVQKRSYILAHGSSTPQNRVTESLIYDRIAKAFDIENWKLTAPKAYVGHTIGPASGDQMAMALGIFSHNIMPGITTIDKVADDVHADHLDIRTAHYHCEPQDIAFINSKGFGGNNATAPMFSADVTLNMLSKRYGEDAMRSYQSLRASTKAQQIAYQQAADNGDYQLIYRFGDGVIDDNDISLDKHSIELPGFNHSIKLKADNPFDDMV